MGFLVLFRNIKGILLRYLVCKRLLLGCRLNLLSVNGYGMFSLLEFGFNFMWLDLKKMFL